MDMIIVHRWFTETSRRVVVSLSLSTPSCFLMQPSIQLCHTVICICPASLTCLSHMCWPSVQCMCRRFSELLRSAWDFLDKGVGAVSTCTCTMSRVCDHTFGQRGGGRVQPQSTADFSCGSACSLWGVLLSVLVILSVHWSPFHLPFRAQTDWGSDCPLQLQPCERSLSKSSHLLNYPFTEVICTAMGGETWTPSAPHSFIRWNEAKKARSVSVHAAYKLQSLQACHCPDYFKTHSLPSTWSPLSASALHLLAGGSLLVFVTTSKREMGATDKSRTRESSTHATETGFLHSWCIIWETPQPPDIFWWKSVLVRRQIRNRWKKIT